MKVRDILVAKGRGIETVNSSTTVSAIVRIFVRRNIASVVVVNIRSQMLGIVTDKAIIDAIANHAEKALEFRAADIMMSPIPSCRPDDHVRVAMQIMTNLRVRHLLVRSPDAPYGIISIGDLVKSRLRDAELENRVLRDIAAVRAIAP